jgi:hypothetical protein
MPKGQPMPARRLRSDRPLSAAERQARHRERTNKMRIALWFISERALSLAQARRVAADALKGHVDYVKVHQVEDA